MLRQENLKQLLESPICVVGDPEIVSLDGMPSFDIIYENLSSYKLSGLAEQAKL